MMESKHFHSPTDRILLSVSKFHFRRFYLFIGNLDYKGYLGIKVVVRAKLKLFYLKKENTATQKYILYIGRCHLLKLISAL